MRKTPEDHAAVRLLQRYGGDIGLADVRHAIQAGAFDYVARQSCSRSLIRVRVRDDQEVHVVINRKKKTIITVLSPEQAADWTKER